MKRWIIAALCAAALPALAHPGHEHEGIFSGHDAVLALMVVAALALGYWLRNRGE